ncbi:pseudouridine synthase [Linnemannia elongata AG-77]|uniref:21S rRNA pseudouridine(2819) synthase n=1 Tax=Linnemannia elongata AG-77 TaxID=1314771 RepID=A0A197JQP4_9FUNG|nr:pseudouridine synthase [Linnemannia elongata AG-77]
MLRALLRITFNSNNSHCKKSKTTTGLSLLHSSSISFPEADEPDLHSQPQRPQNHRKRLIIKDLSVTPDEDGMRLDRFIKYRLVQEPHWATLNNNTISKWLRKRQVKLVLPLSTIADSHTSTDTSNHDSQLLTSGHSLETKDLLNNSTKTITVTTAATRTVAGQMWRIRTLVDPDLVDKEAAVGAEQIAASSGTDQVSHPAAVSSTDHLPLKDWIIYEDERIIVLNKPSGIPVQGGTGVTTSIASSLSLLQGNYPDKPRLVHRLDRTTSGILVLARTRKAAQDLSSRFREATDPNSKEDPSAPSRIQKKYFAIVGSAEPIKEPRRKSKPASSGEPFRLQGNMLMITDGKTQSIQMAPSNALKSSLTTKSIWPSTTDVVIAAQNFHAGTYWALLGLYPRTGRKHQLRVHCAQLLHAPILGDIKYSDNGTRTEKKDPRIYLHMVELELKRWVAASENQGAWTQNGNSYRFTEDGTLVVTAKLENDMQRTMKQLGLS